LKILSIRPAPPGGRTLAHVDVELIDGAKLFGIRVSRADDGSFRAFGQNSDRGRTCAFSPAVVADIAAATISQLRIDGPSQHDRTRI
jgi:hypothetical protein